MYDRSLDCLLFLLPDIIMYVSGSAYGFEYFFTSDLHQQR